MERIEKPLITVVGATSKQGRSVVNSLMQSRRFRVRALTRRKDSPQAIQLQKVGAELWEVDPHRNPDALVQAFEGSAGAFLMTPPSMPGHDDERMLGCQLANAAAAAGVGHSARAARSTRRTSPTRRRWLTTSAVWVFRIPS